jgi:hypothetical protein
MNSEKQEERFHSQKVERPEKIAVRTWMVYCPDIHEAEAKSKKFSFTKGRDYPVLDKNKNYNIKTMDDLGRIKFVDEKFFVPSQTSNLKEYPINPTEKVAKYFTPHETLSKLFTAPVNLTFDVNVKNPDALITNLKELPKKPCADIKLDKGNPLLESTDKICKTVENVFKTTKVPFNSQNVLNIIRENFPLRNFYCNENALLSVDGVETRISFYQLERTYKELTQLISPKDAEKLTAKLVVRKLEKVF